MELKLLNLALETIIVYMIRFFHPAVQKLQMNMTVHVTLSLTLICFYIYFVCVCVQRSEEAVRPFPLHPCLVCPDTEMAFLRCVARILLLCLLPQKDAKSHTLRCCLTEVITTKGADVLLRLYELWFIYFFKYSFYWNWMNVEMNLTPFPWELDDVP